MNNHFGRFFAKLEEHALMFVKKLHEILRLRMEGVLLQRGTW